MRLGLVLEIKTFVHLANIQGLLMGLMLEDQLLEIKECSFMVDALSELYLRLPSMWRICLLTVITLQVLDHKLYLESLLE